MKELYYIEADGGVFVIDSQGVIAFPKSLDEVPFAIKIERDFYLDENTLVHFCTPTAFSHNSRWPMKDWLVAEEGIDVRVGKAVLRTKPNFYAGAIVPQADDKNKVVLVHNVRGFSANLWSLPCGISRYSEAPDETAIRETKEESGLEVVLDDNFRTNIFYVQTRCCGKTGRYSIGMACFCKKVGGELVPNYSDTDKVEYFEIDNFPEETNTFTRLAVEKYIDELKHI